MSEWTSLTAKIPMTIEEKKKIKRNKINAQQRFRVAIDNISIDKEGKKLKEESDKYAQTIANEKQFLLKGIADGKVKSSRLIKLGKSYHRKKGKNNE